MTVIVDNERCYIYENEYNRNGEVVGYYEKTLITKEAFIKCYEKWIKENKDAPTIMEADKAETQ